jgi:DUF4097 and DUF4098 domain-containing protein YvlB
MNKNNPRYYAELTRTAGELRIARGRRPWLFGFLFRVRAEVYLPPSFRGNLRLTNSSGNLSGEADLRDYKTIDISVGSGTVALNRVSGGTLSIRVASGGFAAAGMGGNSFVSVSSGRLEIGELAGAEHRIKVSSGRIRVGLLEGAAAIEISSGTAALEKVRGRMALDVSSGSAYVGDFSGEGSFELSSGTLNLDVRELAGDLRFRLASGEVGVSIPAGISFNLDALTKSGMVRVDEGGTESLRVAGNSSVLRPVGPASAAAPTIYTRTASGRMIINRR